MTHKAPNDLHFKTEFSSKWLSLIASTLASFLEKPKVFNQFCYFCVWIIINFFTRGCLTRTAALTYTTLLAIIPLIAVIFSLLSIVPAFGHLEASLQIFVFKNFVPGTGKLISHYVSIALKEARSLPVLVLVFLFIFVVIKVFYLDSAVNAVWNLKRRNHLIVSISAYVAMLIVGPLLICVSIILGADLSEWKVLGYMPFHILNHIWVILPYLSAFLAFVCLYKIVPHKSIKWTSCIIGSVFSTVLFELAKHGFGLYITYFPTYKLLYGALAVIPLFLLWVYVSWAIFFLGLLVVMRLNDR